MAWAQDVKVAVSYTPNCIPTWVTELDAVLTPENR